MHEGTRKLPVMNGCEPADGGEGTTAPESPRMLHGLQLDFRQASGSRTLRPRSRRVWVEFGGRNVWKLGRISAARLETPSPGFTLHRLRVGVELRRSLSWYGSASNLGDKFYSEHLNSLNPFTRQRVPEMGRALTTGLAISW